MDSNHRSFRSLFTSSPKLQGYATAYKFTTVEFTLRWRAHTGVIEEHTVAGLYDAALFAARHTENTGLKVYAFAPGETGTIVEHWYTRLRGAQAKVCSSGYTSTLDKRGWVPATPEDPVVSRRKITEPLTKIERARAVTDLFTPRLVPPPITQPAERVPPGANKPRLSVGLPDWIKKKAE